MALVSRTPTVPPALHVSPTKPNLVSTLFFFRLPPSQISSRGRLFRCHVVKNNGSIREDELEGSSFFYGGDVIDEDIVDDDEDAESSIDLFFRFLQSMFKKLSKRAKKASRTMLPVAISPQLVSFAVDGVLLLASLSIVKALLEVVCTLGGTVFVVILLLRVVWATISYFQSSGNNFNPGGTSYSSA